MQEREQTLARIREGLAQLNRWRATEEVLQDVHGEREAQFEQWGDQPIPMGTHKDFGFLARYYQTMCQLKTEHGDVTYTDVLLEEVYEALAETDEAALYDELIQVAAVAVKMAEMIRRQHPVALPTPNAVEV